MDKVDVTDFYEYTGSIGYISYIPYHDNNNYHTSLSVCYML